MHYIYEEHIEEYDTIKILNSVCAIYSVHMHN